MSAAPQMSLLGWERPVAAPRASEQDRQAVRVGGRLDEAVLAWCREHVGAEFVLGTMTGEVCSRVAAAPDSPRRRLAALVKAGLVQARCLDRGRSLWRVDGVSP